MLKEKGLVDVTGVLLTLVVAILFVAPLSFTLGYQWAQGICAVRKDGTLPRVETPVVNVVAEASASTVPPACIL